MTTRRQFMKSVPAAGAAFAVSGHILLEESATSAHPAVPAQDHFHPKGKEPSKFTKEILAKAKETLPFADKKDFEEQQKGFIDMERYQFFNERDEFDSIHPSLTRISQLNMNYGLYKVTDDIYQVRGLDISDLTLVRGRTGWIIFDVMLARETARARLEAVPGARRRRACR